MQPTEGQVKRSAELKLSRRLGTFRGHLVATSVSTKSGKYVVVVFDRTDGLHHKVTVELSDISWC